MLPFRFPVLSFLFVSFRSTLIRSHSRSSGAYLTLSLSVFPLPCPLPFVRFSSGSRYSASASSFPFSSLSCLTVAFQVLRFCLLASRSFLFLSVWFPILPFRFQVLSFLFVSFHPSSLRSHSCYTSACLPPVPCVPFFSAFSDPFCFLSSASVLFRLIGFCVFFSLLPGFPSQWFFPVFIYPLHPMPVSMLRFPLWYSAFCSSFLQSGFASQRLPPNLSLLPFGFRPYPHSKHLRFWLLSLGDTP